MKQTNTADASTNATFEPAFYSDLVEMLTCKRHIWVVEQQSNHPVCAWCNYCEGGC